MHYSAGTYRIAASATIGAAGKTHHFERGAVLKPDAGQTVTIAGVPDAAADQQIFDVTALGASVVFSTPQKEIHPGWFGAKGDGVTDDALAIASATAVAAAVAGVVVFLEATYRLGATISMPSNVTWRGAGKGRTFLREHANLGNAKLIQIGSIGGAQTTNVGFRGLTIRNGSATTGSPTSQDGIRAEYVDKLTFDDVEWTEIQGNYGLVLRKCTNVRVAGTCRFYRWTYAAMVCLTECDGIVVETGTVFDTAVSTTTVNTYSFATGSEATPEGAFHARNVRVQGCTFKNIPLWEGLDAHGGENIWFIDNTISDTYFGISVGIVADQITGTPILRNVHIERNTLTSGNHQAPNAGGYGIVVAGDLPAVNTPYFCEHIFVRHNKITGYGRSFPAISNNTVGSITVFLSRDVHIDGNECDLFSGASLTLFHSCTDVTIDRHTARDRQTVGVGVNDAYVVQFSSDGLWGIHIDRLYISPTSPSTAAKFVYGNSTLYHSTQITGRHAIKGLVSGGAIVDASGSPLPIEMLNRPTTHFVQKYGDIIRDQNGGDAWAVQFAGLESDNAGYSSFDTSTTLATVAITHGTNVATLATPANLNWRRIPEGANITIAGAGIAGGDLHARVVANNGLTLTLDTNASTDQAAAACTFQASALQLSGRKNWRGSWSSNEANPTPNVSGISHLHVTNTVPTTITDFANGEDGQLLVVTFGDVNTQIDRTDSVMAVAGNFVSGNLKSITFMKTGQSGSFWWEVSRSTNS